jgi:hypothetical protein
MLMRLMADVVDRVRKELAARIRELRPLAREFERLQRAAAALTRAGVRSVPGLSSPADTPPTTQPTSTRRAGRSAPAQATTPKRAPRRPAGTSRRKPAPRGQTQAKILAAIGAAPGSTTAAVAKATGIPTNTAAATISRLAKQGRVRRLDQGGYTLVDAE